MIQSFLDKHCSWLPMPNTLVLFWRRNNRDTPYWSDTWWPMAPQFGGLGLHTRSAGQKSVKLQILASKAITWMMKIPPAAAMDVLLRLPPLHVTNEAVNKARIYRIMCSQKGKTESTNFGNVKNLGTWSMNPSYRSGLPEWYRDNGNHKPFMIKFSDKCVWQNGFNPDNIRWLVWYLDRYKTNISTGAEVYKWGLRRGHSFSFWAPNNTIPGWNYALRCV